MVGVDDGDPSEIIINVNVQDKIIATSINVDIPNKEHGSQEANTCERSINKNNNRTKKEKR